MPFQTGITVGLEEDPLRRTGRILTNKIKGGAAGSTGRLASQLSRPPVAGSQPSAVFTGTGSGVTPPNTGPTAPVTTPVAGGGGGGNLLTRARQAVAGVGRRAVAAGKTAVRGFGGLAAVTGGVRTGFTGTEEFNKRLGIEPDTLQRFLSSVGIEGADPDIVRLVQDVGSRALGFSTEFADALSFGNLRLGFRDVQAQDAALNFGGAPEPLSELERVDTGSGQDVFRREDVIDGQTVPTFVDRRNVSRIRPSDGGAQGLRPSERQAAISLFLRDGQFSQALALGASPEAVKQAKTAQQFAGQRRRLEGTANLPISLDQSFSSFLTQAQQRRNAIRGLKSLDELELADVTTRAAQGVARTKAEATDRATLQRRLSGQQKLLGNLFKSYAEAYTNITTGEVLEGAPSFEEFATSILTGDVGDIGVPPQTAGGEPVSTEELDNVARQIQAQPGNEDLTLPEARQQALRELQRKRR